MKQNTAAHFSLLGTNILFAVNFTAIKQLVNTGLMAPFALNLIRITVTASLLWILFWSNRRKPRIDRKDYGRFFLCSLTGIAINQLFFVKGLSLTYSIHASLLMLTTPILITVIAAWILKERLTLFKLVGLLLGITGAVVLITARQNSGTGNNVVVGDMLIIVNAISYTIYFILVKPLMKKYDPITVLRVIFSVGFILVVPFCWAEFVQIHWAMFGLREYIILASVVLGGTFFAYLLNIYGIKVLGASIAGAYIYSQVVFTAVIAMIFLKEDLSLYKIIAGLLIASGVYLSNQTYSNDKQLSRTK